MEKGRCHRRFLGDLAGEQRPFEGEDDRVGDVRRPVRLHRREVRRPGRFALLAEPVGRKAVGASRKGAEDAASALFPEVRTGEAYLTGKKDGKKSLPPPRGGLRPFRGEE